MRKCQHFIMFLLMTLAFITVSQAKIGIIVNRDLYPSVRNSIDTYVNDLKNIEKKDVWINSSSFVSTSSFETLRDSLRWHNLNDGLEGAVFIGDLPIVEYEIEDDFSCQGANSGYIRFPTDLYFMDLNGLWQSLANEGAWGGNASSSVFDNHIDGSGDVKAEIWMSRIIGSSVPQLGNEAFVVNDYFSRLSKRMNGDDQLGQKLLICTDNSTWSGSEEWAGAATLGYRAEDITTYQRENPSGTPQDTRDNWTAGLRAGQEYALIVEHSSSTLHCTSNDYFYNLNYLSMTGSGEKSNARFYNLFACSNARYTISGFLGGLYAWGHNGLVSLGSTKSGSMLRFDLFNQPLSTGISIGEAFKKWLNDYVLTSSPADACRISWHYGMVLSGASSVKLHNYNTNQVAVAAINCGGPSYTAVNGIVYSADMNYSGGTVASGNAAISGTSDQTLYQSERWGNSSYTVAGLASGSYTIKFQFAETYCTGVNQRKFDVVAEGQTIIQQMDIFALAGGMNRAYDVTRTVTVTDGTLNISFTNATANNPKICAFVVTQNNVTMYSLSTSANPAASGTVSGGGSYASGTPVTVTAVPATGYAFSNWSGDASGTTNHLTVTMDGNKNIVANFTVTPTFTISTLANPTNGGTVSGSGTYTAGSRVWIEATAADGYIFSNWSGDLTGSENPATAGVVRDMSITANFVPQAGLVRVTPQGANALSSENSNYAAGMAIDNNLTTRWSSTFSDPQWITFDMGSPKSISTVVFDWEAANARNYTLEGSNDQSFVTKTTLVTKTNMASVNHRIDSLSGLTGSYRYYRMYGTARNLTYGYSIYEARFYTSGVAPTYTITATPFIGGNITPGGAVVVNEGASQTFTITPSNGYVVNVVTVDGVSQGSVSTYTFNNVTANHTITASFKIVPTYTITATPFIGGNITPGGVVAVNEGASQTFTITPSSGYVVNAVTVDGVNQGSVSTYTFNNVTANHTITASFSIVPTYTITATAGANGTMTPVGNVPVIAGANQTFTITPNTGCVVYMVTVDGVSQGSLLTYTFNNVTGNHTIDVTFRQYINYIAVPGRIEAENYKNGGEGSGYHDLTAGNSGSAPIRNDDVDIEVTQDASGAYDVGWTDNGEWLAYDINVTQAGIYKMTARVASGLVGTKTLTMTLDGNPLTTISTNVVNGWQVWSNAVSGNFTLTAGVHVLRVTCSGGLNLNYYDIATSSSNLITNGDFSNGSNGWLSGGTTFGTFNITSSIADWTITNGSGQVWEPQMMQAVSLVAGRQYTLCFDVRTSGSARSIIVGVNGDADNNYVDRGLNRTVNVTTSWVTQSFTFTANATDATSRLDFNLGGNTNAVLIDNVKLVEGTTCN